MPTELDKLYCLLLTVGFVVMREAAESRDHEWLLAELELMHNIPSLISEAREARHHYFWEHERGSYVNWVSAQGRQWQRSRMLTYYEPIWRQMEPLIANAGRSS